MPVFTVHAPASVESRPVGSADKFVFVRDGFHFWAFLTGLLWLAYYRLWLVLLGYLVFSVAVTIGLAQLGVGGGTRLIVWLLIGLLFGLEAANLRRWTLSRRGWRQIDIVVADDLETAERRFFDRWNSQHPQRAYQAPVDPGAPPPERTMLPPRPADNEIVGLFPWPGTSR